MTATEPSFALRLATVDDLAALRDVEVDADARYVAWGYPATTADDAFPAEVLRRAIAEGRVTVAVADGSVVGFAYVGRVGDERCLGQLSVARSHGRRGIGSALVARVLADAARDGETSVVLNTQRDVPFNAPWYAARGFDIVPEDEWSPALRAVAEVQRARGISWERRVHMRHRVAGR